MKDFLLYSVQRGASGAYLDSKLVDTANAEDEANEKLEWYGRSEREYQEETGDSSTTITYSLYQRVASYPEEL